MEKNVIDDVWYEIFLRLPLDSIFKFRCISKVWFSILSNPNFLKQWYKLNNRSLPWGFLGHFVNRGQPSSPLNRMITYPDSHSQFLSHHQNGFSFSFLPDPELYVLGSANGLFLCGTNIYTRPRITYYVCNPLTQKWVVLPPSPRRFGLDAIGFMCNDECFSVSVSYKVIRIPKFEEAAKEFKVEIFDSGLGEWRIYDVLSPQYVIWDSHVCDNLVTHNGVWYLLQKCNNKILAFCVNGNTNHGTLGNECRLINIPDQPMDDLKINGQCLGESEGSVCYARYKVAVRSLSVWVLDGDWYMLCKDVRLHDMLAEIDVPAVAIQILGFNPSDKKTWFYLVT